MIGTFIKLGIIEVDHCFRVIRGVQGITWRLGFGINNPEQPEGELEYRPPQHAVRLTYHIPSEWQDHPADLNLPLTPQL